MAKIPKPMTAVIVAVCVAWVGFVLWKQYIRPGQVAETCRSNLKQIAGALSGFHKREGHFPAAWSSDQSPHSWRIALLPHLGEADLFQQYNMLATWDAPANGGVLNQRPQLWACPNVQPSTHTAYQGVVGFNTAWPYENEIALRDFTDGTSNTIHVMESYSPTIPWASMDDSKWTTAFGEMPKGNHTLSDGSNSVLTTFADGAVRRISTNIDRGIWQQLLTPQGGRPIAGMTYSQDLTAELARLVKPNNTTFASPVAPSSHAATKMLPVMDQPVIAGENMLYCPTFALAWKQYSALIPQQGETALAKRLANVSFTVNDIDLSSITIKASTSSSAIASDAASFAPGLPSQMLTPNDDGPVAYCALKKQLPFIAEFEPFENPLTFSGAAGEVNVRSFGVTSEWDRWGKALGQIRVMDYRSPDDFIIQIGNLAGESLFLAKMAAPKSIADGVSLIRTKIASTSVAGDAAGVVSGEQVVIPILEFSLVEDFADRLNSPRQPVGSRLRSARQLIQFRLDETGAVLFSEAAVIGENGHYEYKVGERTFFFDKPFLLLLRQNSNANPYFAAWVANADVMSIAK